MSQFKFFYPEWQKHELEWLRIEPHTWVRRWAALCLLMKKDRIDVNRVHKELIDKAGRLSGNHLELVGRWKESCLAESNDRWKSKTPVAYDTWMLAKTELPKCPAKERVAEFLEVWSAKKFAAGVDKKKGHVLQKRFGLSRSTTLLHFISGGDYPILDSNVQTAMARLGSPIQDGIEAYLNSFCPLFSELAVASGVSGTEGLRMLDNALFQYGATDFPQSQIDSANGSTPR